MPRRRSDRRAIAMLSACSAKNCGRTSDNTEVAHDLDSIHTSRTVGSWSTLEPAGRQSTLNRAIISEWPRRTALRRRRSPTWRRSERMRASTSTGPSSRRPVRRWSTADLSRLSACSSAAGSIDAREAGGLAAGGSAPRSTLSTRATRSTVMTQRQPLQEHHRRLLVAHRRWRRQDRSQQLVAAMGHEHACPRRRRDDDYRVSHGRPRGTRPCSSRAAVRRPARSIQHAAQLPRYQHQATPMLRPASRRGRGAAPGGLAYRRRQGFARSERSRRDDSR